MSGYNSKLKYHGNVCISGLTASGKSTHSHLLAGEFGLTYVSASQIKLNFSGVSPIQPKDFWITNEATPLWNKEIFRKVETELLRLEKITAGYIFDTISMPWVHREPALCIWLESDIESRKTKSIISHRGRGQFSAESYIEKINQKDLSNIDLYKKLYGIEVGTDLSCFNLIIDISSFIKELTLESSLDSIARAHRIIRSAAGYYLTNSSQFKDEFQASIDENASFILHNSLL